MYSKINGFEVLQFIIVCQRIVFPNSHDGFLQIQSHIDDLKYNVQHQCIWRTLHLANTTLSFTQWQMPLKYFTSLSICIAVGVVDVSCSELELVWLECIPPFILITSLVVCVETIQTIEIYNSYFLVPNHIYHDAYTINGIIVISCLIIIKCPSIHAYV